MSEKRCDHCGKPKYSHMEIVGIGRVCPMQGNTFSTAYSALIQSQEREIAEWIANCRFLMACIDTANEAGAPVDEADPEDIAEIDAIYAKLKALGGTE